MAIRVSPLMGLGAIAQGYEQQRLQEQQRRNQALVEQAYLRSLAAQKQEEEAGKLAFGSLLSGGGDLGGLAGLGQSPPMAPLGGPLPGVPPQYTAAPAGSGMASGLPDRTYGFPAIAGSMSSPSVSKANYGQLDTPQDPGGSVRGDQALDMTPYGGAPPPPGGRVPLAPSGRMVPGGGAQLASAGGDDSGPADAAYIAQQARIRNLNPSEWLRVGSTEGGLDGRFRLGDSGKSGGPFQFYTGRGGGLGTEFQRDTGKDPLSPSSARAEVRYGMDKAIERSGGHPDPNVYHGLRRDAGSGISSAPPVQQIQQTAGQVVRMTDPIVFGRMSLQALAQQVEKANPGADPAVKMMAVERLNKLLAPGERQQFQLMMLQNREEMQLALKQMTLDAQQSRLDQQQTFNQRLLNQREEFTKQMGTGGQIWVNPADNKPYMIGKDGNAKPVTGVPEGGLVKPQAGGQSAAVNPQSVDYMSKAIAAYQLPPLTGWALRSPYGQQVMQKVLEINPNYQATDYTAKNRGLVAFTSGRQGDSVRSFSVAIDHLATMQDAADALANGDTRALNMISNEIQRQFGYEGPVDFNFVKSIVGAEVSKAVVGGVGALTDREELRNAFETANSPEQLQGVARRAKQLMAGQLAGYRRQAQSAGFGQDKFDAALSPRAKQELDQLAPAGGTSGTGSGTKGSGTVPSGKHYIDEIIEQGGKRYRVTGGDMNDPDVEEVQ